MFRASMQRLQYIESDIGVNRRTRVGNEKSRYGRATGSACLNRISCFLIVSSCTCNILMVSKSYQLQNLYIIHKLFNISKTPLVACAMRRSL